MSCEIKNPTNNPLCSDSIKDLKDNAVIMDQYINSQELEVNDRLGEKRKTWAGIEKDAQDEIDSLEPKMEQLINDKVVGAGGIEIAQEWGDREDATLSQKFIKNNLNYVTPEMFGAVGDAETNDNDAIVATVVASNYNEPILISKIYKVNANFNPIRFHLYGTGGFKYPNGNIWYVENRGNHENIIYIKDDGTGSGMTEEYPTTLRTALDRLRSLNKPLDGYYVIQFPEGVSTFNGVRLTDMPIFRKYLRIRGVPVTMNTEPLSIWDGSSSTEAYALLAQNPQPFPLRLELENLYVKNFHMNNSTNTGFCVTWTQSTVYARNIWLDNVGMGIATRQGYLQVLGGKATNADIAYSATYHVTANIGSLSDVNKVTIEDCKVGVTVGRASIAYVQSVHFKRCGTDIECTRISRFRSQKCIHEEWADFCYAVHLGSVQTPDNMAGNPDIFIHSDRYKPVLTLLQNSTHLHVDRETGNYNTVSRGYVEVPKGISSLSLLSSFVNNTDSRLGDFAPFRLPKYFLNTPGARLELTFDIQNIGQVGGTLALYTQGSSINSMLSKTISIPKTATTFECKIVVINEGNNRLFSITRLGDFTELHTASLTSAKSELDENLLVYRLYVTSNGTEDGNPAYRIRNMRGRASL